MRVCGLSGANYSLNVTYANRVRGTRPLLPLVHYDGALIHLSGAVLACLATPCLQGLACLFTPRLLLVVGGATSDAMGGK